MPRSRSLVSASIAAFVVFAALTVFYATTRTSFLAASEAKHYKHAVLFAVLALLSLVVASLTRPRPDTRV